MATTNQRETETLLKTDGKLGRRQFYIYKSSNSASAPLEIVFVKGTENSHQTKPKKYVHRYKFSFAHCYPLDAHSAEVTIRLAGSLYFISIILMKLIIFVKISIYLEI